MKKQEKLDDLLKNLIINIHAQTTQGKTFEIPVYVDPEVECTMIGDQTYNLFEKQGVIMMRSRVFGKTAICGISDVCG